MAHSFLHKIPFHTEMLFSTHIKSRAHIGMEPFYSGEAEQREFIPFTCVDVWRRRRRYYCLLCVNTAAHERAQARKERWCFSMVPSLLFQSWACLQLARVRAAFVIIIVVLSRKKEKTGKQDVLHSKCTDTSEKHRWETKKSFLYALHRFVDCIFFWPNVFLWSCNRFSAFAPGNVVFMLQINT